MNSLIKISTNSKQDSKIISELQFSLIKIQKIEELISDIIQMSKKYKYHQQQESPAYHFKVSIRQKQRQQIRRQIINQYYDLDHLQLSINGVHQIIIIHFHKFFPQINYHCQNHQKYLQAPFNKLFSQKEKKQHELGWRIRKMSQLISDISFYLNSQVSEQNLQQLLICQQHNGMKKNNSIKESMKKLIQICIPYIYFIIQKFEQEEQTGEKDSQLKQQLDAINSRKILEECSQILNRLSYLKQLNPFYTFKQNNSQMCKNKNEQCSLAEKINDWVHQQCQQYEPIKLICKNLIIFISPGKIFYGSLVAIGNLLQVTKQQQQRERNTNLNQYYYQLLSDNHIQDIIAGKFFSFTQYMQEAYQSFAQSKSEDYNQSLFEESNIYSDEEAILWFTQKYTKFLYVNQLQIYQNLLLRRYLYAYIINKFVTIHRRSEEGSSKLKPMCGKDRSYIKKLTQLLNYVDFDLDNIFIINTLIPLIRQHWHLSEIASLWKYLTFSCQYQIIDLLHLSNIQDRITVKNSHPPIIDDQEQYDNCQGTASISFVNSNSRLSSMFEIFVEIFQTIAKQGYYKQIKKRDRELLGGMYNILLDMQIQQAQQLWNMVYADNEGIQCRIESYLIIQQFVDTVESYFGCSRGLAKRQ